MGLTDVAVEGAEAVDSSAGDAATALSGRGLAETAEWWMRGGLGVMPMQGKGRGVVALEAMAEGDVVAEEYPLGYSMCKAKGWCGVCFLGVPSGRPPASAPVRPGASAFSCADCGEEWCGEACQATALQYHWLECGQADSLVGAPGDIFRSCIRTFFATPPGLRSVWEKSRKAVIDEPLDRALDSTETRVYLSASLPNHKAETKNMDEWPELKRRVAILAKRIRKHFKETAPDEQHPSKARIKKQLLHILMVAYTNTFNIYRNWDAGELGSSPASVAGSGLYPGVSLLNHSCLPNTSRNFVGKRMEMRVIRAVEAGEELTTTYGTDVKRQLTPERQASLDNWCFTCACEDACGSPAWRAKEAAYWGFACRFCVDGACLPANLPSPKPKQPWSLEQLYRTCLEIRLPLFPGALKGSLPVACHSCARPDRVPGKELEKVVTALKVIRKQEPFRPDLGRLVLALHPRNHDRLRAEWTVELERCSRGRLYALDERALEAMWAVTMSLHGLLNGPHDIDSADDAVEAIKLILARPLNGPSRRRAVLLRDVAARVLAAHYGPASPQALRLLHLPIPPFPTDIL